MQSEFSTLSPAISALAALFASQDSGLAEAALTIARHEYPGLEVRHYLRRLDSLAERARADARRQRGAENLVISLNRVLFEEEGLVANTDTLHDPRNSFLNEVLDRKEGIPLTLAIVYLEVGWRLGLPLEGVVFPGQCLIKLALDESRLIVLDPQAGGAPLPELALLQRLSGAFSQSRPNRVHLALALRPTQPREIVSRLLYNLREIYLRREQWGKLLGVLTQLLVIQPEAGAVWRDRGAVHQYLECKRAALEDFRHYLGLAPEADDADIVQARVSALAQEVGRLH